MKETKFKQTEVGMIPSDWEIKPLKDIAGLKAGKMTSYNDFNPKYPCFGGNGIRAYLSHYSHDGIYPIIGRQGELCGNVNLAKGKFYATEHAVVASPKKDIDAIWLYYQLTALNLNQYATGCAQPGLSVEKINDVYTQVPPTIEEQQRIANALSDVDTLIANLEKLIAKKKNIKQGAMQQLLTGRKRLPGFGSDERRKECHSERSAKREVEESNGYKMTELGMIPTDWEVKNLADLGYFFSGSGFPLKYQGHVDGKYPFYKVSDFNNVGNDFSMNIANNYVSEQIARKLGCKIIPKNAILFAKIGAAIMLERKKICTRACCADNNMMAFICYDFCDAAFMNAVLAMIKFADYSASSALPSLSSRTLGTIQIAVPHSKAEQTAIANVLSDMDAEISALETKLAKYRKLKTGMMQQLLTGKIRLV